MTSLSTLENEASGQAAAWRRAIDAAHRHVRASAVLDIAADAPDWTDSGMALTGGDAVTLLSQGVVWLSREYNIGFEGTAALWYRIGDGPVERVGGRTASVVADRSGPLRLAARPPGPWLEQPDAPAGPDSWAGAGGIAVAAVCWQDGLEAGLAALAAADPTGLAAAEAARHAAALPPPAGWHPHPVIGKSAIFAAGPLAEHRHGISCRCVQDVGILQYPVDVPLDATTRLNWSWQMTHLPSTVPENQLPTHDYLSIAIEFENGLDLTYLWSSSLPVGTHFRCPLPYWDQRETHWVVRSGHEELGRWLDEQRPILADYQAAIGGAPPSRIVAVWLIAVSLFQRDFGECAYAGISISNAEGIAATVS